MFIRLSLCFLMIMLSIQSVSAQTFAPRIIGKNIFGLAVDFQNDPVQSDNGSMIYTKASAHYELNIHETAFDVASFDQEIGALYVTKRGGSPLIDINTVPADTSLLGGVTGPQGGFPTRWGTLLLGETTLVDGAAPKTFIDGYSPYYKLRSEMVNPYLYGWSFELVVMDADGHSKVVKNFAAGRVFPSKFLVMPDGKSLYLLDANHSGNLYLFVADEINSFSKGKLFVAQRKGSSVRFQLLGKTSGLKAKFKLKKLSFEKLISREVVSDGACTEGYTRVSSVFGTECLKIKDKKYAGIFEPLRVSALLGVEPFSEGGVQQMSFQETKGLFEVESSDGLTHRFSVGFDKDLDSEYILQEML